MIRIFLLMIFFFQLAFGFTQSKKASNLLNEYTSVALKSKKGLETPIIKWTKDTLTYNIEGQLTFLNSKKWIKFIDELSLITNITFIESDEADITIFIGTMNEYFEWLGESMPSYASSFNNWGRRRWNSNYELFHSSYCLTPQIKIANYGSYQLKRWFLISLGLNGTNPNNVSVLHNSFTQSNYYLSKRDKQCLRLHYHPFIKPGMKMAELKDVINSSIDLDALAKDKL
ncbi:hypothetical protein [Ekhidna sp.]|uniref:hypothetical protein n=1 Tax=Ekhidna sp. TaxID=2608089 RepID=UPI00329A07FA